MNRKIRETLSVFLNFFIFPISGEIFSSPTKLICALC